MTNDTSYRKKGRAVFLAAIMVLSMVAGAAVLTGSAAADHTGVEYDTVVSTGDSPTVWEGQTIRFSLSNGTTYNVEDSDGTDLGGFTTNESTGNYTLDTSALAGAGDYSVINDSSGNEAANFTIRVQDLSASFDDASVTSGQNTSVTLDTNRPTEHDVVVSTSSDDVDVATVFGNQNRSVTGGLGATTTLTANTSHLEAGTYEFTFEAHDTGVTANATITVEEGVGTLANFGSDSYSGVIGDEVEVDMTTDGEPDNIYVNVTDDGGFYTATLNISPSSDAYTDGLTLSWNTYNASNASNYGFSVDNGEVVAVNNTEGAAIDADYLANSATVFEFESYTADPEDPNTDFSDITAVSLSERSTDSLTISTAPSEFSHTDDYSEILDAATESSTIAQQDLLIAQVEASGLYGYMNTTPTAFNDTGGLELAFSQETTSGPYDSSDADTIGGIGDGNATIHTDSANGTFYALIDASEVDGLETGEEWSAEFSVSTDNPFVPDDGENETVSDTFTYEERNVELTGDTNDNDALVVPGTSDATIDGETNVAPGTTVNVRMNFNYDFATASGEVAEDGTFAVNANLSDRETGTQFDTRVRVPQDPPQVTQASIIGDGTGSTGPSFGVTASANGPVTVGDSASLEYTITNDGDEAGTTDYTVTVGGEEVANGTTDELAPGNSTTLTYEDFDTGSAGDISWEVTTDDNSATGTLTVEEESTDDGGDDGTADEGDDGNDSDGDGGQAGFGLIVALFALIGAALLALRRQN